MLDIVICTVIFMVFMVCIRWKSGHHIHYWFVEAFKFYLGKH